MYGVPKDIDLHRLRSVELHMIWIGRYDVHFVFYDATRIAAMHEVVVRRHGVDVAVWTEEKGWSSAAFQELLHEMVVSYAVPDAHTLTIQFGRGHELVIREHEQWESIQIFEPGSDAPVIC